jgi:hypothetical protein
VWTRAWSGITDEAALEKRVADYYADRPSASGNKNTAAQLQKLRRRKAHLENRILADDTTGGGV